jgi:DNA-binding NtrC family response regulator
VSIVFFAKSNFRQLTLNQDHCEMSIQGKDTHDIVGRSMWAKQMRRSIKRVASYRSSVMIAGPSGTGKELIAAAIHRHSPRSSAPFVAVDCASIPPTLFASQLFGHVKGAFSGAEYNTLGNFRAADGGTLFLDEIGELSLELQAQLLRTIQQRKVVPVGSHQSIPVDVRLIAATNRRLEQEVQAGRFRLDLFYRLNVVRFNSISLSERPEDIAPLCEHFLDVFCIKNGLPRKQLSPHAIDFLESRLWPGNVRELQNILERAVVFIDAINIAQQDLINLIGDEEIAPVSTDHSDKDRTLPEPLHSNCDCGTTKSHCSRCFGDSWPKLEQCECLLISETLHKPSTILASPPDYWASTAACSFERFAN